MHHNGLCYDSIFKEGICLQITFSKLTYLSGSGHLS